MQPLAETQPPMRISRQMITHVVHQQEERPLKELQIQEAQRYIAQHCAPTDLNPIKLAHGGKTQVLQLLRQAIQRGAIPELPRADEAILEQLYSYTVGLGVLDRFLADTRIEQINIQGPQTILLQVNGLWQPVTDPALLFRDVAEVRHIAESLARRVDRDLARHNMPILDIRFDNPVLRIHINQTRRDHELGIYIRRGREKSFSTDFLLKKGTFTPAVWDILHQAAQRLISVLFLGPVGSGKTVLLEKYIDSLPNIPIVVVDDAGDCQPTHSMCAIYDLPPSSYFDNDTSKHLSLGGMTRAALREGDVLIVAETRGGAEAGTLISEALSMRSVATTAHGESAAAGLTRLANIAQRPPSPYAGSNDTTAVRQDLATAFPLVVQVERSGERRFISGIFHNQGWQDGRWQLNPIVTTHITATGEISWAIHSSLDPIKQTTVLDKQQQGQATVYDASDVNLHLTAGLNALDNRAWDEAVSELAEAWRHHFGDIRVLRGLQKALPHAAVYPDALARAEEIGRTLTDLQQQKHWLSLADLMQSCEEDVLLFALLNGRFPTWKRWRQTALQNSQSEQAAKYLVREIKTAPPSTPWQSYVQYLNRFEALNVEVLSNSAKQAIKRHHIDTLCFVIHNAPLASQSRYNQKLIQLVGQEQAKQFLSQGGD